MKARSDRVPNPTRVEVVTGFIWKHAMAAAATNPHVFGPSVLVTHAVKCKHAASHESTTITNSFRKLDFPSYI
ncbi:hypothetical protein SOVF_044730 [Spinacia oleracea]|nr:hypothetical protein SOVF_044730 [Spinacia oleracea]